MGDIIDEDERAARLLEAQGRAAALFAAVGSEGILRPGVLDSEASAAIRALAAERFGMSRHWHKRIVRSGPNTLQPYQENPPDRAITDDDIVYADFGPVFEDWEADFGRTWVVGADPVKLRLRHDLARVFAAGKAHFTAHPDITSADLFAAVAGEIVSLGWEVGNYHLGHIVGEFPHELLDGGRRASMIMPGNDEPLRRTDPSGRQAHWILEIHMVDRALGIGGFYEELLTL